MTAPAWIDAAVREFGRAAGADGFALNGRGCATMKFETGLSLAVEYTGGELVMEAILPADGGNVSLQRLLSLSHPHARNGGFYVRTGLLARSGRPVMAIRLAERDVALPQLNAAFGVLWRLAGEIGGAA